MPMKKWFLGVFGDAEFEFDLKKYYFISVATYTYENHVLVDLIDFSGFFRSLNSVFTTK